MINVTFANWSILSRDVPDYKKGKCVDVWTFVDHMQMNNPFVIGNISDDTHNIECGTKCY